jgi:pimeloyl-ACP methyl ester carboxylesterase
VDHGRRTVVLTIRGTLSLDDCVADVVAHNVELQGHGQRWGFAGEGRFAHSGMLRSAEWLLDDLREKGVLEAALRDAERASSAANWEGSAVFQRNGPGSEREQLNRGGNGRTSGGGGGGSNSNSSNSSSSSSSSSGGKHGGGYDVVTVGHSFGAGVAMLVALSLRSRHPSIRCFGMGMPSAVVDSRTAAEAKDYCSVIIQGSDIVSRLSTQSLARMRTHILDAIARARANKFMIMQALIKGDADDATLGRLMHAEGQAPRSAFLDQMHEFLRETAEREALFDEEELYMPGRIYHMEVDEQDNVCASRRSQDLQKPSIAERGPHDYREVFFHHRMAVDHFPHNYIDNVEAIRIRWNDRYATSFMDNV